MDIFCPSLTALQIYISVFHVSAQFATSEQFSNSCKNLHENLEIIVSFYKQFLSDHLSAHLSPGAVLSPPLLHQTLHIFIEWPTLISYGLFLKQTNKQFNDAMSLTISFCKNSKKASTNNEDATVPH